MSASILESTKKALDVPLEYEVFDGTILMHINSVFSTLTQLGVGPVEGFEIEDTTPVWTDYLGTNVRYNLIKSYMYLRVKMLFDPPGTSFLIEAITKQIAEQEWRILNERETRSTLLLGERKKITGHPGDEYSIRLGNPVGTTLINADGTYRAVFTPQNGSVSRDIVLDVSQKASGFLFLPVVIEAGVYTVSSTSPRRTILVIEVTEQ